MRKICFIGGLIILLSSFSPLSWAILSMELTRGITSAIPIAIVSFTTDAGSAQDVSAIIANDLQMSGRFKIYRPKISDFKRAGTDNVVLGQIKKISDNQYEVNYKLLDLLKGADESNIVLQHQYKVTSAQLRMLSHHISDAIYKKLTGMRGIFSTKLAYVLVKRGVEGTRYVLEVCDQDGYNPKPLLESHEPIMSPSWAPNGKQLAYVSFEKRFASIYLQEVETGTRTLLSQFPGINGAPAWSPDGRKLALVLSKSGAPNIYIMDVGTRKLKPITNDFYINTEPAWSANGEVLLFTSNRTGGPQIYQVNLATNAVSRVSYAGDYNARASFTRDGKSIAMIHRVSGIYNIALLNLDAGTTKVLTTQAGDSASPSVAPNGSMILYDTYYRGRNVLAMVSADGRVQLVLPARNGEAQDPAWSPFLS